MDLDDELREIAAAAAGRAVQEVLARRSRVGARVVLELWDEYIAALVVPTTQDSRKAYRRYLLKPFAYAGQPLTLGDMRAADVTPPVLNAWIAMLRSCPSKLHRPLAQGTVCQIRYSVQACFKFHRQSGVLSSNPFDGLPVDKNRNSRKGYFDDESLARFLPHCRPVLAAMARTMYRCGGLRREEVRNLRKIEVIHSDREFEVRRKGGKTWRVIITDDIYELVQIWSAVSPGDYVFGRPGDARGRPVPKSTLWDWMDQAGERWGETLAGEKPTLHHLRHGFFQASKRKRADIDWAADQGAVSPKVVAEVYGTLRGGARDEMRRLMNEPAPAIVAAKA